MKITVKFEELKYRRKLKELGKFFVQNEDFVIEIDSNLDNDQKLYTFVEEVVHFLIRVILHQLNKKMSVLREEELIKSITGLLFTKLTMNGKNGEKRDKTI